MGRASRSTLTGELASAHARGTPLVSLVATRKHSKNCVTLPLPTTVTRRAGLSLEARF